jgi:hypothetical protein
VDKDSNTALDAAVFQGPQVVSKSASETYPEYVNPIEDSKAVETHDENTNDSLLLDGHVPNNTDADLYGDVVGIDLNLN